MNERLRGYLEIRLYPFQRPKGTNSLQPVQVTPKKARYVGWNDDWSEINEAEVL